ncbi:MAG: DNA alkylation repair protein [Chloroflexi bacterium]|nr:MAG: DNA alkylation repair protein [Chloroflexota bacterium]
MTVSRSAATERAVAFVAARRESAEELGARLADVVGDPEAFAIELRNGMEALSDPHYVVGQQLVAPGIGDVLGVRWPLNAAVARGFRKATRRDSPAQLLFVADRLFRERPLEIRWFAFGLLDRLLPAEPERTWQLLRRAAREAADWITVDSLAHPYGRGILLEPYRWAELEQLVFSPSRWERRLVGSTLATMPFIDRRNGRTPDVAARGLRLIHDLLGDDEPDVQKALAWALRSLAIVDLPAVEDFCRREAAVATEARDGNRAWVIRDALAKLTPATADELRDRLAGIRRRQGTGSTSRAAEIAGRFDSVHLGGHIDEPPLAYDMTIHPSDNRSNDS